MSQIVLHHVKWHSCNKFRRYSVLEGMRMGFVRRDTGCDRIPLKKSPEMLSSDGEKLLVSE